MYAFLESFRATNQDQGLAVLVLYAVLLHKLPCYAAAKTLPLAWRSGQRVEDLATMTVVRRQVIELLFAKNVFQKAVSVEDDAFRLVFWVLHDGPEDLVDWCNATAATDHNKCLDLSWTTIDQAFAVTAVLKLAYWAFHLNELSNG